MKVKPSELAAILGLGRPRVSQLIADGIFELGSDRKLDLGRAVRAYVVHLESGALNPEIAAERRNLIAEQTRRLKLGNDKQEGRLIPADTVQHAIAAALNVNVQALEGLPGRVAAVFAAETNPALIEAQLKSEIRAARQAMADKFSELAEQGEATATRA